MNAERRAAYYVIKLGNEYDVAGNGTTATLKGAEQHPTRSSALNRLVSYNDYWTDKARIVRVIRRAKPKPVAEVWIATDEDGAYHCGESMSDANDMAHLHGNGGAQTIARYVLAVPQ